MTSPEHTSNPSCRSSWFAALFAVAATYFYFLIFAEFAFLEIARSLAPTHLRLVMTFLGAGGIAGAVWSANQFSPARQTALLAWSFRGCALGAVVAWRASTLLVALGAALLIGFALGTLTVALSSALRAATRGHRLGVCIGAGTGLAYATCNVPVFFHASAAVHTLAAATVAGLASLLPRLMAIGPVVSERDGAFAPRAVPRWVIVLLALVGMDSAAFYIVQHTAELQNATWHESVALTGNAAVHLFAALFAGFVLDRGGRTIMAAAGAVALGLACLMLNATLPATISPAWLYTAGVSLYSVVLVEYPARSGRPAVAALTFAVAGWFGSALGIGMAQDLARIPTSFVATAIVVIAAGLFFRARQGVRVALPLAITLAVSTSSTPARADTADSALPIARGREVYISEGCIHCHSQFIRPRAPLDVLRWGPAEPLTSALAGTPPLVGTRRQGPDLSHVGNRRSAEWNRVHLIEPRAISPGSRMPAYAHLFAHGDDRGDALVAYLASLGADTLGERRQQIATWTPDMQVAISPAEARRRFSQLCVPCHGGSGHGDGPLVTRLSYHPPDWSLTDWAHLDPKADPELALCRIIKFGLPGLPMAGHEYLPDADVVGLARFVRTLHKERSATIPVALQP